QGGGGHQPPPFAPWTYTAIGGFRNPIIPVVGMLTLAAAGFYYSTTRELRTRYPERWIPSMLWAREFHDPQSVAFWKEQLAKEEREWIEPHPDWVCLNCIIHVLC
ncbi:hypothetical protein BJ742DRAFT_671883, partial [Cladochytrium replicatum]